MKTPDHEKVSLRPQHAARLVPIYPETEGLTSKWLRAKIQPLLQYADELEEFLPSELLARRGFFSRAAAVRQGHFPDSPQSLERARERLPLAGVVFFVPGAQPAQRGRKGVAPQAGSLAEAAAPRLRQS